MIDTETDSSYTSYSVDAKTLSNFDQNRYFILSLIKVDTYFFMNYDGRLVPEVVAVLREVGALAWGANPSSRCFRG